MYCILMMEFSIELKHRFAVHLRAEQICHEFGPCAKMVQYVPRTVDMH
jgi:hypothetical protein